MALLNIRNLPDEVHAKLRIRAAKHGRSMEGEARDIITAACSDPDETVSGQALQALVDRLYGSQKPAAVVDELIQERRREAASE